MNSSIISRACGPCNQSIESWSLSMIPQYPCLRLGILWYFSGLLFSYKSNEHAGHEDIGNLHMEEVDKIPCLEQLLFELIHICNSWCWCLQPTSSADKFKSSLSYALAFRWLLSLIISLNAHTFSSSLKTENTCNEGIHFQQALTDFVSKWRTLFVNVYVPCSSFHILHWCFQSLWRVIVVIRLQ